MGLSYVTSLFLQLDRGVAPLDASLALTPLLLGIITASFVGRPLLATWGRHLVPLLPKRAPEQGEW